MSEGQLGALRLPFFDDLSPSTAEGVEFNEFKVISAPRCTGKRFSLDNLRAEQRERERRAAKEAVDRVLAERKGSTHARPGVTRPSASYDDTHDQHVGKILAQGKEIAYVIFDDDFTPPTAREKDEKEKVPASAQNPEWGSW